LHSTKSLQKQKRSNTIKNNTQYKNTNYTHKNTGTQNTTILATLHSSKILFEDAAVTSVHCVRSLWGTEPVRVKSKNAIKQAYNPIWPDSRLQQGQYANNDNRATCYTELALTPTVVALTITSTHLLTEGWPGWAGLGGIVKYQDGILQGSYSLAL